MQQTLIEFIVSNFKLSVFISVIVFKFFSIILDELVTPFLNGFIDPDDDLSNKKIRLGDYVIEYGKSCRDFIVLFIVLVLSYFLFSNK